MKNVGVQSIGIKLPIIREGDDLLEIIIGAILKSNVIIEDNDVIGITESIVARAQGNYVTVDDIVKFMTEKNFAKRLILYSPIMSRNRFSIILKAFARYAEEILILLDGEYDEQGNPNYGVNPVTGVNIQEYYKELCEKENCKIDYMTAQEFYGGYVMTQGETFIDCTCHPKHPERCTCLSHIMNLPVSFEENGYKFSSGYNDKYGLLGSNKADEETLKLFPLAGGQLCKMVQAQVLADYGVHVEVMIYGDGCFKDPIGGIWEFADPVTAPGYTKGLEGTPNEIKIKYFADSKYKHLDGKELESAIDMEIDQHKGKNLVGSMTAEGTTPRRYVDLLASLMDLTSGSGDKGTPVVIVKNYFNKYSD